MGLDKGDIHISKKKTFYPIQKELKNYLERNDRYQKLPLHYNELLRFSNSIPTLDKTGKDTFWETVVYPPNEMREICGYLTQIYALLKTAGDINAIDHLSVANFVFCSFGNSKPFRIKIINNYNDNYDYYYIKTADASRIYGLELEHILSPNRINFIIHDQTLVEEHIIGIPGDVYIGRMEHNSQFNHIRLAKEFVKFNERCFIRLLGDMRAYNFVIDVTEDFDDVQYRIRAIDFDQQCYEGRKSVYLPQYFKENFPYVELCMTLLNKEVVHQYQQEERSLMAKRIKSAKLRLKDLIQVMKNDIIAPEEKITSLAKELATHYNNDVFLNATTMGALLKLNLEQFLDKNDTNILND